MSASIPTPQKMIYDPATGQMVLNPEWLDFINSGGAAGATTATPLEQQIYEGEPILSRSDFETPEGFEAAQQQLIPDFVADDPLQATGAHTDYMGRSIGPNYDFAGLLAVQSRAQVRPEEMTELYFALTSDGTPWLTPEEKSIIAQTLDPQSLESYRASMREELVPDQTSPTPGRGDDARDRARATAEAAAGEQTGPTDDVIVNEKSPTPEGANVESPVDPGMGDGSYDVTADILPEGTQQVGSHQWLDPDGNMWVGPPGGPYQMISAPDTTQPDGQPQPRGAPQDAHEPSPRGAPQIVINNSTPPPPPPTTPPTPAPPPPAPSPAPPPPASTAGAGSNQPPPPAPTTGPGLTAEAGGQPVDPNQSPAPPAPPAPNENQAPTDPRLTQGLAASYSSSPFSPSEFFGPGQLDEFRQDFGGPDLRPAQPVDARNLPIPPGFQLDPITGALIPIPMPPSVPYGGRL